MANRYKEGETVSPGCPRKDCRLLRPTFSRRAITNRVAEDAIKAAQVPDAPQPSVASEQCPECGASFTVRGFGDCTFDTSLVPYSEYIKLLNGNGSS